MALFGKLFAGRPSVEVLTFDPDDLSLLFTSESTLTADTTESVDAKVAEHKLRCQVRVESVQAGLYFGTLLEPKDAAEHLGVLLPRPARQVEQRGAARVERMLRVSSAQIPNYQGITGDLSTSGAKIRVEGPMAVGEEFDCQIELDDHTVSRLDLVCQVRWCRPDGDQHLVGVQFVALPRATHSRLAYFVNALTRVERGVLHDSYQYFD
jgi:hypothetical protein